MNGPAAALLFIGKESSMAKKSDKDLVHKSSEPHILPCKMSQKEKSNAGVKLAAELEILESIEFDKKTIVQELSSKIKTHKKHIHDLSDQINRGIEMRSVDCELRLNVSKLIATLVRKDTGEIVNERPMTEEEKQMDFNFEEKQK